MAHTDPPTSLAFIYSTPLAGSTHSSLLHTTLICHGVIPSSNERVDPFLRALIYQLDSSLILHLFFLHIPPHLLLNRPSLSHPLRHSLTCTSFTTLVYIYAPGFTMIVVVLITAIFIWFMYLILTKRFPLDDIPEPKRSWFFGHIFQIDRKAPYRTLRNWSLDFKDLFKFKIFWNPIVVLSDRKNLHDALRKQSVEFCGRPENYRNKVYHEEQSGIAATDTGLTFRGRRQCIYLYLSKSPPIVAKLEEMSQKSIDRIVEVITNANGEPIDGPEAMLHAVIDILMSVLQGDPLTDVETQKLKHLLFDSADVLERGKSGEVLDQFPFHRHFGNRCYKKLELVTKLKNEMVEKWFDDDTPKQCLINHIKNLNYDDQFKFKMEKKEQQKNVVWDLVLNGVYPMTSTLSMILNILAHRIDIQEKLRKEVEDVCQGGCPTLKHRPYMPYHEAVLLEACRYGCVVPLGKPHKCTRNTTLGQYKIPRDTEFWPNLWAMHHSDKYWGEDVFEFQPKRFLDDNECLLPEEDPLRQSFMAFGGGYRGCLGQDLAMSRMFLLLARLVQKFKIFPETTLDRQPSMDSRDMVQVGEFLMPPEFKVCMGRTGGDGDKA